MHISRGISLAAAALLAWLAGTMVLPAQNDMLDEDVMAGSQPDETVAGAAAAATDVPPEDVPLEINADHLAYEADLAVLKVAGNVVVTQGDVTLKADQAQINRSTKVVVASGSVVLTRGTDIWEGEELTYNFRTKKGFSSGFDAFTDPFYITAESAERVSERELQLDNATLSTCEGPNPEFHIKARSANIQDGKILRAKGVTFYLGRVPFLYLPYVKRDMENSGWDFVPGYSSRSGAYLLTAYNYPINNTVKAATHLDYRTKRGVGVGQDFSWKEPGGAYNGKLKTYYTHDRKPYDDSEEEALYGDIIDNNRGLISLSHFQALTDRDYVIADVNWQSDPDVLEDFFDKDFRYTVQPENRGSLTHRGDNYTATFLLNGKLNDFYDSVNRLPEVSLDVNRIPLGDSGFYYESEHSAVSLERDFASEVPTNQVPLQNYDALRFDTFNRVLYPTRHFGFLNLIPSVGYRATYYSKTRETLTFSEVVEDVDENGVPFTTVQETSVENEQGAKLRNIFNLNLEGSFKAFKGFHEGPLWGNYQGLRHVAEPFAEYTFVPEPNVRPGELYRFDEIDRLDKRNDLRFGMRNQFQTRRKGKYLHDLVDAEIWTLYRLDKEEFENDFGPLQGDVRLRPLDALALDFEFAYNYEDSVLDSFNSQLSFVAKDRSRVTLDYRFVDAIRDQVSVELDLFPRDRWSLNTYWRYALDDATMEEQEYILSMKNTCMGYGLGFRTVAEEGPDDYQFWVMLWLLAFPDSAISLGR